MFTQIAGALKITSRERVEAVNLNKHLAKMEAHQAVKKKTRTNSSHQRYRAMSAKDLSIKTLPEDLAKDCIAQ